MDDRGLGSCHCLALVVGRLERRDKILVTLALPAAAFSAIAIQGAGDEGFVYFAIILFASIWPPARLGLKLRRANAPTK